MVVRVVRLLVMPAICAPVEVAKQLHVKFIRCILTSLAVQMSVLLCLPGTPPIFRLLSDSR